MKQPAAFRATYSDWKLIKTRGVVQVVFEVPLANHQEVLKVLGGMPNHANESWFGIAPLTEPEPNQPRAKRDWKDTPYPQQAGIRINEPTFAAYLREEHSDEWHETGDADACLKMICRIESKRELGISGKPATLWFQLESAYQAWLVKEKVGA